MRGPTGPELDRYFKKVAFAKITSEGENAYFSELK
jgi:hypothetical protein